MLAIAGFVFNAECQLISHHHRDVQGRMLIADG
jgi:hypothetical protein